VTAPPGLAPTTEPLPGIRQEGVTVPSRRERIRDLMAGGLTGPQAKAIIADEDAAEARLVLAEYEAEQKRFRKRKLSAADTRIGGPVWRLHT
jgi:hypothetical protein